MKMKMKKLLMAILPILSLSALAAGSNVSVDEGGIHYFLSDHQLAQVAGVSSSVVSGSVKKSTATGISTLSFSWKDEQSVIRSATWKGQITYGQSYFSQDGVDYWVMSDGFYEGYLLLIISCDLPTGESAFGRVACRPGKVGPAEDMTIPVEWRKTRTLLGLYGERCGDSVEGTVQVKCGKANKKGIAKVSMTISPFNGKKVTYRSTSVDVSRGGGLRVEWPDQKYFVEISGDEFFGEPIYGDSRPACSPNAVWSADVGGRIPDGNWYAFGSDYAFRFWRRNEEWAWQLEDLFDDGRYCINLKLAMPLLTGQTFAVRNGKIDFGKKPSLKYKEIGGFPVLVGLDAAKPNIPGTKITYNAKTGVLKGSFVVYADPHVCYAYDGKLLQLKKHSFKMTGVVLKGNLVGKGVATCKKPAYSCPMTLYRTDVTY